MAILIAVSMVSVAQAQDVTTEHIPLEGSLYVEKTTILMHVSSDNPFPWGHVKGVVQNPAEGYDVVIQMHQNGVPVHLAQVSVQADGSFEYRFRALDVTDGEVTRIFEGDYTVTIFKVVHMRLTNMV